VLSPLSAHERHEEGIMVTTRVVTSAQHRVLSHVEATTTYGYRPSAAEVMAWYTRS